MMEQTIKGIYVYSNEIQIDILNKRSKTDCTVSIVIYFGFMDCFW